MTVPSRSLPLLVAASAAGALTLSACAGSAGGAGGSGSGGGEGFAYGAPQEEVDAALADLEPVTLTYQPSAASPTSVMADSAHAYKEMVEERSGGKITIELVWGQAIAGYTDVPDALADGRLDLSYALPIYMPGEFPSFDAAATSMSGLPISPVVGEMVSSAVSAEIGWSAENLLAEYEAEGVVPFSPVVASGAYYSVCTQPGTDAGFLQGKQVRVASTAHHEVANALGASPVSMEYVEVFEALQRGTIDCTFAQLISSAESGVLEVAPHVGYTSDADSMSSRAVGAELAGSSYQALPLAYQQILFDSAGVARAAAGTTSVVNGTAMAIEQAKGAGGGAVPFDEDVNATIAEANGALREKVVAEGLLGDDIGTRVDEAGAKWAARAEELGYTDGGTIEDVDEWWTPEDVDFTPWAEALYEELYIPHRPA
ncbi:C4-dicarboxylate ABC transporter substrate-binding protein [Brevibacterium samyangense]|uniref:TRAP-type C4-dicarboxylate transport system, substrate-binding protein n=1 Tax=Brevibacterium samyangense TaxID=366888 RepID=A0ABP5EZ11_9MICO